MQAQQVLNLSAPLSSSKYSLSTCQASSCASSMGKEHTDPDNPGVLKILDLQSTLHILEIALVAFACTVSMSGAVTAAINSLKPGGLRIMEPSREECNDFEMKPDNCDGGFLLGSCRSQNVEHLTAFFSLHHCWTTPGRHQHAFASAPWIGSSVW